MGSYTEALKALNPAQKKAVETIEGPVLVIAGPGTGKTQLLGVRAAHILAQTDTLPQQILCLTFTENAAQNMRERLTRFIGQSAYNVQISTYHAFGSDIIRRFPEAFAELRLQSPVDELTKHRILKEIIESFGYDNPLKQTRHHLGDLIGTISESKRALLDAESLRAIAIENQQFIALASENARQVFSGVSKMPSTHAKAAPLFEALLHAIATYTPQTPAHSRFGSLAAIATQQLQQALVDAADINKSTPLTNWKKDWLVKDDQDRFIFDGALQNNRITALADVCERYDATLQRNGWYDFDDMIMLAGKALNEHPDLKFTLQEQYLYIMLDEFQDTNAAQLKLIQLLTDNPVNEDRPNVLAVGDDDQAIYAFQGAEYSNMLDFSRMYRDVRVINLTENYRSSQEVLATAEHISGQIGARLVHHFEGASKTLTAKNSSLPKAHIERRDFLSDVAQHEWMASEIEKLIQKGVHPREIAVLAPKHRYLEPLVPFLAKRGVPIRYEKRENVLEAPVIKELLTMSRLVLALNRHDEQTADALWPTVLSFDFWQIPVRTIWQFSWQVRDTQTSWGRALLDSTDLELQTPALLLLTLATRVDEETCERMMDYLIGNEAVSIHQNDQVVRSPLRDFYLSPEAQQSMPGRLYETVSHLTVLRAKLREYQGTQEKTLTLGSLVDFVNMYEEAEQRMSSTSPYNQQSDAVQLMTVFKAKGLEFEHVFLPSIQDEVWGGSARRGGNKLTLPANLAPMRYAGTSDDERLRILFVAITRAKYGLHLTGYRHTYSGKQTKRLQYLDEQEQENGEFKSLALPLHAQNIIASDEDAPSLESLELGWQQRHISALADPSLRQLLQDRLERYQLSPTHLTRFVDLVYGGPEAVFMQTILGFPSAPSASSQFGDAIHETLEWMQHRTDEQESAPPISAVTTHFTTRLQKMQFTDEQRAIEQDRGVKALRAYFAKYSDTFKPGDKAEQRFTKEGVFIGDAHLSGKIDRLEIDRQTKTIIIADYKTGKSHTKWTRDASLHKYRLQLYLYRALVEGSHTFKGYRVTSAYLDFVEPDKDGQIHRLHLQFDDSEYNRVRRLAEAIWRRVTTLELPNTADYTPDLSGIELFESELLTE